MNKRKPKRVLVLEEVRRKVADYMTSEGCSCCQNVEAHKQHKAALGELLNVPKYKDDSGYDFYKFQTKKRK